MITSLASEARRAPALAALRQRSAASSQQPHPTAATATPPSVSPCPPPFAPVSLSGSRARGLAYERKVGKVLASRCAKAGWKLWDHQWFAYKDDLGVKHFQPDFIIERETDNVLVEVKLTFVDTSAQINKYLHYLKIFGLNCFPLVIVRNLVPTTSLIITDFGKITPNAVLHLWI